MDIIFSELDGKHGCQIKIMCVLIGTLGDGSFAISEKWILDRTGMSQQSYSRARIDLVEKGWIDIENGNIYLNLNKIQERKYTKRNELLSATTSYCDQDYDVVSTAQHENVHNIEKQKINKELSRKQQDQTLKEIGKTRSEDIDFFTDKNMIPSAIYL